MQIDCKSGLEKIVSVKKLWPKQNILSKKGQKWPISFVVLSTPQITPEAPLVSQGGKPDDSSLSVERIAQGLPPMQVARV